MGRGTASTISSILLGIWQRSKAVIGAWRASSSGVARKNEVNRSTSTVSSCGQAAAQPTSNSSNAGLIFERTLSCFIHVRCLFAKFCRHKNPLLTSL